MANTQESVIHALRECYDPEIPVNIVDLGLIYEVRIEPVPPEAGEGETIEVDMTLTAPGCPSSGYISQQVKQRLEQMPGVRAATVNVVWSPPWGPERISAEGKKRLGIE